MSALASLERFGEEAPFFINWRSCKHCLQSEWPLVSIFFPYCTHLKVFGGNNRPDPTRFLNHWNSRWINRICWSEYIPSIHYIRTVNWIFICNQSFMRNAKSTSFGPPNNNYHIIFQLYTLLFWRKMKIAFENINERMSCDEFLANLPYMEMIIRKNPSIYLDISKKYIIRFLTEVTGNVFKLKWIFSRSLRPRPKEVDGFNKIFLKLFFDQFYHFFCK